MALRYLNVPSALNMCSVFAPVAGAPPGGVHVGTGSVITAGSAMGVGWADGVTRCMGITLRRACCCFMPHPMKMGTANMSNMKMGTTITKITNPVVSKPRIVESSSLEDPEPPSPSDPARVASGHHRSRSATCKDVALGEA